MYTLVGSTQAMRRLGHTAKEQPMALPDLVSLIMERR